jgi:hypothetical protein
MIVTLEDTLASIDFNLIMVNFNREVDITGLEIIVSTYTAGWSGRDTGTAILSLTPLT